MKNNFDNIIGKYINENVVDDIEKLKKTLPKTTKQVQDAIGGIVTGASNTIAQKDPNLSALIDKLKDPKSTYSNEEKEQLIKHLMDNNLIPKTEEKPQETEEKPQQNQTQTTQSQQQQQQPKSSQDSITYNPYK